MENKEKILELLIKNKTLFLILLLVLITLFFRTESFSYSEVIDDWAKDSVYLSIKRDIATNVNNELIKQGLFLSDTEKELMIEENFNQFLKENKEQIDNEVIKYSELLKNEIKDENGVTYLPALDTYYWLRHARNVVDHGYAGDEIRDGKQYDTYMVAPKGRVLPVDMLHAYVIGYSYKFFNFFNRDLDLMGFMFFMPLLLSSFTVILMFIFIRKFTGDIIGFVSVLGMSLSPFLITKTRVGSIDTEIYVVLFPILIMLFLIIALDSKELKKSLIYISISALFLSLFALTWSGYIAFFYLILGFFSVFALYYLICNLKTIKQDKLNFFVKDNGFKKIFFMGITFLVVSFIPIFLVLIISLVGTPDIIGFFLPVSITSFTAPIKVSSIWPNVLVTVQEVIHKIPFLEAMNTLLFGGVIAFLISIIGILSLILKKDRKKNTKYFILFGLWLIPTIYASLISPRFYLLLLPIFTLCFGLGVKFVFLYLSNILEKSLGIINKKIVYIILFFLILLFFVSPITFAYKTKLSLETQIFLDDAWYNSLKQIDEKADKNAIITSWWDLGHVFKAIGNRKVTFDGASQNTPMAHWVGKLLLTNNERLAVGILRMLDCGSNDAFDELDKVINKDYKSIDILNEILVLDKENAKKVLLNNGLTNEQAELVLKNTHCNPPEAYLITSDDMIPKAGVWSYFGSWDFKRVMIMNKFGSMDKTEAINYLTSEFKYNEEEANKIYSEVISFKAEGMNTWTSKVLGYSSNRIKCNKDEEIIKCQNGFTFNTANEEALFPNNKGGYSHPISLAYETPKEFKRIEYDNGEPFSIILGMEGDDYFISFSDPGLEDSIFTRLYFFKGKGLKYFKLFNEEKHTISFFDVGKKIYVWKIDWKGL